MKFKKTAFFILSLCVCLSGCGGDTVQSKILEGTKPNIRKVAIMYMIHSSSHDFQGPKDEADFKAFIQGDPALKERLGKFGINTDDFDSYMTSNRTGDKFDIRWGLKSYPMAPPYPVAFEPNALDGMRQIGMCGGETKEVTDDDEYDALWAGKNVDSGDDEPSDGDRGAG